MPSTADLGSGGPPFVDAGPVVAMGRAASVAGLAPATRVLVIDDDEFVRSSVSGVLRRHGYDVGEFESAEHAISFIEHLDQPLIAVVDWLMPGMDGVDLVAAVGRTQWAGLVYWIMLTSRGGEARILQSYGAGVDDFLQKPVRPGLLLSRIAIGEKVLGRRARERGAHPGEDLVVCAWCGAVRDMNDVWHPMRSEIAAVDPRHHATHGICGQCAERLAIDDGDHAEPAGLP